jgi:hypothetical protein
MKVSWYAPNAGGANGFTANAVNVPGRYNFVQGAVYRLKLSDIRNLPGVELYPTLEVVPSNLKTDAFLAHSAVPVHFTNEDFEQVAAGNFVVKVIYLPDPQFQDLATTGPDEVVSSRLEPGADPIAEAYRRGSILLVIRMGNIDLDLANSPTMDAPSQYPPRVPMGPGGPGGHGMLPGMRPMANGMPMIMTPNGPMMMGPNGPMMMAPGSPNMGGAGMPQMPMPPAGMRGAPSTPGMQPTPPNTPVSMLPDPSTIQQTQSKGVQAGSATAAQLASQGSDDGTSSEKKSSASRKWWWPGSSLGSKADQSDSGK